MNISTSNYYKPYIDGLRALAVIVVVVFHAFPRFMPGGFIGVDIFFVISGFLISRILFDSLNNGSFSFFDFYFRRVLRIFPALILVLFSCFIVGWFTLLPHEYKELGKHIAGSAVFISNFLYLSEVGYFDKSSETKPLLHLWSLGIEEQFYIFWPIALWIAWKSKKSFCILAAIFFACSFSLNVVAIYHNSFAEAFYAPQ